VSSPWAGLGLDLVPLGRRYGTTLGKMLTPNRTLHADTEVPYIKAGLADRASIDVATLPKMWASAQEILSLDLRAGDLLVLEGGEAGRHLILAEDLPGAIFQNSLHRIRGDRSDIRYLYYCLGALRGADWFDAACNAATLKHLTVEKLRALPIPDVPPDLRAATVERLDRETAHLEDLAAECHAQGRLLAERRQAEIDGLLVHGAGAGDLRTALIPWEVKVPSHWDVLPLRYCTDRITVGIVINPSHYYVDEGVPVLRGLNIRAGRVNDEALIHFTQASNQLHAKSILRANDVVVVRTGSAGAAAVVPDWMVGGNAIDLLIVTPGYRFIPKFLELLLNSDFVQQQVTTASVGALQAHFNVGALKAVMVVCPPKAEQEATVERLADALGRLDAMSAELDRQLALIEERRRAMILDALERVAVPAAA
jgi:type I restriction enzyme, S subunit